MLLSVPALADFAVFILRLVVGVMFALSGFFKLTDGDRKEKMRSSLEQAGVSRSLAPVVSLGELLGGLGVALGLLTAGAALILLVISLGALVTTAVPKAEGEGVHKLEDVLYTPEALLCVAALLLVAVGAGEWSLDAILWR